MNVVLYTNDFEPITVLDLPLWLLDQMERQGGARVAVPPSPQDLLKAVTLAEPPTAPKLDIVEIRCDKFRWKDGSLKTILTTPNEELALILRPAWLSGQQQSINWYKQTIHSLIDQLQRQFKKP